LISLRLSYIYGGLRQPQLDVGVRLYAGKVADWVTPRQPL
jgi:hypothetical protein